MALVLVLLIMAAVSILAIAISTDSTIQIKASSNRKDKTFSFTYADFATQVISQLIEDNIFQSGWDSSNARWDNSYNAYRYTPAGKNPYILVYENSFATLEDYSYNAITINSHIVNGVLTTSPSGGSYVNIHRTGGLASGAAIQMAAGYEGVGKGAASGGYHSYYDCDCNGLGANQASTIIEKYHRHVSK